MLQAPLHKGHRVVPTSVQSVHWDHNTDTHHIRSDGDEPGPLVGLVIENKGVETHLTRIAAGVAILGEDRDLAREVEQRSPSSEVNAIEEHVEATGIGREVALHRAALRWRVRGAVLQTYNLVAVADHITRRADAMHCACF